MPNTYWDKTQKEMVRSPKTDQFLEEILEVCRKHGLAIGHEDSNGSFIIEPYSEEFMDWLMNPYLREEIG